MKLKDICLDVLQAGFVIFVGWTIAVKLGVI